MDDGHRLAIELACGKLPLLFAKYADNCYAGTLAQLLNFESPVVGAFLVPYTGAPARRFRSWRRCTGRSPRPSRSRLP